MMKQETPAGKKCARRKVFASAVRERVEYSAALAEQILGYIIDGKTLVEIEKADGMPSRSTILKWRKQHEEFGERYAEPWTCAPMLTPTRSMTSGVAYCGVRSTATLAGP